MQWYYSKNGAQNGPASFDDLKSKIASGEVGPRDLVWKEGMADWVPSGEVGDLRSLFGVPAAVPTAAPAPVQSVPAAPTPQRSQFPAQSSYQTAQGYGAVPQASAELQSIPTYLWQSIVVTLLCCWPLGIPAIVFAAKTSSSKGAGDVAGALENSKKAKTWTLVSLISGLVVIVLYGVLVGFGAVAAEKQKSSLPVPSRSYNVEE